MQKLLGIDFGTAKIGLALADSEIKVATPYKVLPRKNIFVELFKIIKQEGINLIVVGWPISMSGQKTESTKRAEEFVAQLKKRVNLPVMLKDERLTSKLARSAVSSRQKDDAVAAMHILQSYLDGHYD